MGRFITTDPIGYEDGPNLYQFALNNPVEFSDPLGFESIRQLIGLEDSLVEGGVGSGITWGLYTVWNAASLGFLGEHGQIFENYSGEDYLGRTTLALGKTAVKAYVMAQTGGLAARLSYGLQLSAYTAEVVVGATIGVTTTATDDFFSLAEGGPTHSFKDYAINALAGGALSGLVRAYRWQLFLGELERGGSWLLTEQQYMDHIKGKAMVGRPDGQFMISARRMNRVIYETGGDPALMAEQLGAGWKSSDTMWRVDVVNPTRFGPRIPSAKMSGANSLFIPGGFLPNGAPEVTTNQLPKSEVWANPVPKR